MADSVGVEDLTEGSRGDYQRAEGDVERRELAHRAQEQPPIAGVVVGVLRAPFHLFAASIPVDVLAVFYAPRGARHGSLKSWCRRFDSGPRHLEEASGLNQRFLAQPL